MTDARIFRKWYLVLAAGIFLSAAVWLATRERRPVIAVTPTEGISQELAAARKHFIRNISYDLSLSIPESLQSPVEGQLDVRLESEAQSDLVFDFAQPAANVRSVRINGRTTPVRSEHGHLIIPADLVRNGENTAEITFTAGSDALNRNTDYLYSLFVPARASRTFPCFDQPDLKARLKLTLEIPASWVAVANTPETARRTVGPRTTLSFAASQPLPTYLFGFAAGRFQVERGERKGRAYYLYHRETDREKVDSNRDTIFDLHQQAIDWLETYTARKYPFDKFDMVLLPAFQFAGMEHAGAIFYNAPALFLEKTATQEQQLARANTIAHETAHMWFGDLVTMKWFDDVWMKEVFANFMAAKIVNPSFPGLDHELRFLLQHYPSAYEVDRTSGANPIRQTLTNLNEAGSLYGAIIYDKAPIVMRHLETLLGEDQFREGLREYLATFAFDNASWIDLIDILDRRTDEDLAAWSRAWVDEPGRPTIATSLRVDNGLIAALQFTQSDPRGRSLLWNQRLRVALGYESGARITQVAASTSAFELPNSKGLPSPRYVLANGEGFGYGLFKLDPASKEFCLDHLPEIGDAVTRATAWITLWDDMLEGGIPPELLAGRMIEALPKETDEQNVQRVLSYLIEAFWTFLDGTDRQAMAPVLERALQRGVRESSTTSEKAAYFAAFRRSVTTPAGIGYLERVWRKAQTIPGLTFSEVDFIAMAQELAIRNVSGAETILTAQQQAITNPDRRARFAFVLPALSKDESVRDEFFASLASVENRRHEPWVLDGLAFLNHPLRRAHAERYIEPSLNLLRDVQQTGDIFFPMRWTAAVLDGHNSPAAARIVTDFLAAHSDFPPRLVQTVQQASDGLMRASKIVHR